MQVEVTTSLVDAWECDSIECNPNLSDIFACGYYHLEKKESGDERVGKLAIYEFVNKSEIKLVDSISRFGVLDSCWNKEGNRITTAEANGKISNYSFENKKLNFEWEIEKPDTIALAVDQQHLSNEQQNKIIGSFSNGDIVIAENSQSSSIYREFNAHPNSEVWTIGFSKFSENLYSSGGDDCRLKFWDLREEKETGQKRYEMGVTTMEWSFTNEYQLFVGSYDESVSLWDVRNIRTPLGSVSLGGGVWRIKQNKNSPTLILTATMYNQFHLLRFSENDCKFHVELDAFGSPTHTPGSLAYGAGWFQYPLSPPATQYAALCSFYDKVCSCWSFEHSVN